MNNKPAVSIIIPCYNAQAFVKKCIESVIYQTFKNIEIVLVNDGSTDKTLEIINEYARNDNRIVVIDKPNGGVSAARNSGIEKACGKYLMFVDSDDWIDLNTCEIVFNEIESQDADVVMWSYIREFHNISLEKNIFEQERIVFENEQIQRLLYRRLIGLIGSELYHPENMDALNPIWTKIYKSKIIKENQIRFTDLSIVGTGEDGLFNLEVFYAAKKVVYINRHFYHYFKANATSCTTNYKVKLYAQWQRLFDIMLDKIQTDYPSEETDQAINNRICWSIVGLGLNILQSKMGHTAKIREIKHILDADRYRKAYKALDLNPFPQRWKVFFVFAKINFASGLYFMLILINKKIGSE